MASKKDTKEVKPLFQTYYNKPYVDSGIEFDFNSSLTDQDYRSMTDIDYLLAHMAGHSRTPIYGIQDNMTFEDWSNEMALVKRRFMDLDEDTRRVFGNAQNFLKWCADFSNYEGQLPTTLRALSDKETLELKQKEIEEKEDRLAAKIAKSVKGE